MLATLLAFLFSTSILGQEKNILILAGPITGHGKNTHEYEKSAVLIKHLLDCSDSTDANVTVVFDGWPDTQSPDGQNLLDSADTIVMISDGGDHNETNHPLYVGDRFKQLEKQMNRGCGFVQLHWSTFNPSRFHDKITEWVGGYFDYEKGDQKNVANKWYSAIKHYTEPIELGEPDHPISRGVKPFRLLEEFYYRIRFREKDSRLKKIVMSQPTGEKNQFAVGWAVERKDGGRGFGFTGGHYYANWWDPNFRKLILNAIVWSAGDKIPKDGIQSSLAAPTKALIVTGHNHPAHDWQKTTSALLQVIENDPRILVDVTDDPEFMASEQMKNYDLVVMNYSSWDQKGLSEKAKAGLVGYLKNGGGLSIIHFANGSWTDTLPNKESDWPEYRNKIARRIWVHGQGRSGHDAFGSFRVEKTDASHPITQGLKDFNTQDELYYRQEGTLPITPLVVAKSRDTGKSEPMAWAYQYENARVFQTVLGHGDVSILMAGHLLRRGCSWAAGIKSLTFDPPTERKTPYLWRSGAQWKPKPAPKKTESKPKGSPAKNPNPQIAGKFGQGLNAKDGGVFVQSLKEFRDPDLTFECWIKIDSKTGFNIIAASETKSSLKHWELYTHSNSGVLSVYVPGIFGDIKSDKDVCDGQWHFVAMTMAKQFIKLHVDGKLVKSQPINFRKHTDTNEGFAIGSLVEKTIGCSGVIDDVRISSGIRDVSSVPTTPLKPDKATVGYWDFDLMNDKKEFQDQSRFKTPAVTTWKPVQPKTNIQANTQPPKKITGHWGEDAVGFRWTEKDSEDNRWAFTKHGRFLTSTIPLPGGFAEKGLVIKVGDNEEASVCYDLKRLNMMAAWSGGFLEFQSARFGLIRHLRPVGEMLFHNKSSLKWNSSSLKYQGLYQHGQRQLLSYSVSGTNVLESPWLEKDGSVFAVSREFHISPNDQDLLIPLSSFDGITKSVESKNKLADGVALQFGSEMIAAIAVGEKQVARVIEQDKQLWLSIPKSEKPEQFKILIWRGKANQLDQFGNLAAKSKASNISTFTKPGRTLWGQTVQTNGVVGEQAALGYAVDTIRLPFKNPYNSLFFVSGHDWFSNGDMVVSTVHGEVWIAKNVDDDLQSITWKRFATGLYQPLGIKVVDNQAFVLCRDQIVRLHDRDENGEADFYECFHADVTTSTGVHDYVCCLETDSAGNFYYIHANDGVVRVSSNGKDRKIVATGFRNPNGMGVRSDGLVTAAPQEGEWTPASMVCEVIEGRHYGYRGPKKATPESPLGYEKPTVYLPRLIDNSSGGQFWTNSNRWGLLQDQLIHLSYGKCTMHLVLRDSVSDNEANGLPTTQGTIVPFPFVFESGVSRGRMNPHDGQLYVSGLKGWTTAAVRDGSIQRVRLVDKNPTQRSKTFLPTAYKVHANGIEFGFSHPIATDSIDANSFKIEAWNYRYSKNYGSPEFKLSNPNQQGRDPWSVKSAKLLSGNKSIFLEIPELRLADQLAISINLQSADGIPFDSTVYSTVKSLRKESIAPGPSFSDRYTELESKLRPGVYLTSHRWAKRTADLFVAPNSKQTQTKCSLSFYLKTESPDTNVYIQTGNATIVDYQMVPAAANMDTKTSPSNLENSGVARQSSETKITLKPSAKYYQVNVTVETTQPSKGYGALELRWFWDSESFSREPIPATAFWFDKNLEMNLAAGGSNSGDGRSIRKQSEAHEHQHSRVSQLILEKRCIACHDLGQDNAAIAKHDYRAEMSAPNLTSVSNRFSAEFLIRKILDPDFEQHDASMPSLLRPEDANSKQVAANITEYLRTVDENHHPKNQPATEITDKTVATGEQLFEQLGCIGCHHLPIDNSKDRFNRISLKFTGQKFSPSGLRSFLKDPHEHFPFRRMGNFALNDREANALASFITKYSSKAISTKESFPFGDAKLGREQFISVGCANCHQVSGEKLLPQMSKLSSLKAGCLSSSDKISQTGIPEFDLADAEKEMIAKVIAEIDQNNLNEKKSMTTLLSKTPKWKQTSLITQSLRCNACHSVDEKSASLPEIIYEEGVVGLNPERLPNIGQVGNKLHTQWMQELFAGNSKAPSRPWLKTRMPAFGGYAKSLAHGLTNQAGIDHDAAIPSTNVAPAELKIGQQLLSQNQGLDCRQCHGIGNEPPRGDDKTQIVLGVNFSESKKRIRKEYYDRWMMDPLRIDPQTKMPKYSADGKTTKIGDIHKGDAKKQFDALWKFLQSVPDDR